MKLERLEYLRVAADQCELSKSDVDELFAAIDALRLALQPFAAAAERADKSSAEFNKAQMGQLTDHATIGWGIRYGHVKAARAILSPPAAL